MSKPRAKWGGYVKNCVRDYPRMCEELNNRREWLREPGGSVSASAMNPRRPTEKCALDKIAQEGCTGQQRREFDGVRTAIEELLKLPDGMERFAVLNLVFWSENRRTLAGAAFHCNVSERTARRWHTDFLNLVAEKMGLTE